MEFDQQILQFIKSALLFGSLSNSTDVNVDKQFMEK